MRFLFANISESSITADKLYEELFSAFSLYNKNCCIATLIRRHVNRNIVLFFSTQQQRKMFDLHTIRDWLLSRN